MRQGSTARINAKGQGSGPETERENERREQKQSFEEKRSLKC